MVTVPNAFAFQPDAFQADAFFDANIAHIKTFDSLNLDLTKTWNGLTVATGLKTWNGLTK